MAQGQSRAGPDLAFEAGGDRQGQPGWDQTPFTWTQDQRSFGQTGGEIEPRGVRAHTLRSRGRGMEPLDEQRWQQRQRRQHWLVVRGHRGATGG